MTRLQNTAETGLADGTTVTVANSDDGTAGDAFSSVTIAGGAASETYESTAAYRGALGIHQQWTNAVTSFILGAQAGPLATNTVAHRFYFKFAALSANNVVFMRALNSAGGNMVSARFNTSGTVSFLLGTSTVVASTAALSLDTWYRYEFWITPGTTTTDGRAGARVYLGDDTSTPLLTYNSTTANYSTTGQPRRLELGRSSGTTSAGMDFDEIVIDDGIGETFIGPVPAATVHDVSGTVDVTTGASGDVTIAPTGPVTHQVSGTVAVSTDASGDVSTIAAPVIHQVSGRVDVTSEVWYGFADQIHRVSGRVDVVTGETGTVSSRQRVSGTAPVVTGASGSANLNTGPVIHQVSGTVAVTTGASGDATRVPLVIPVSGTVVVATNATATVRSIQQTSGVVQVLTDASGSLSARYRVAGTTAVVTTSRGAPTVAGAPPPATNVYLGDIPVKVMLGDVPVKLA
jgi:hypothetical protein